MVEKSALLKLAELLEENGFYIMKLDGHSYNETVDGYATLGKIEVTVCPTKTIKWVPISNWKQPSSNPSDKGSSWVSLADSPGKN